MKVKSYKSLLKQANVQHLYGRLVGQLVNANDEVCKINPNIVQVFHNNLKKLY